MLTRRNWPSREREREFFIDNLLVRIHFIIAMVKWTGIAPRELEFHFPGSLISRNQVPPLLFIALGKDLDDTREALHCRPRRFGVSQLWPCFNAHVVHWIATWLSSILKRPVSKGGDLSKKTGWKCTYAGSNSGIRVSIFFQIPSHM
jgi:hypothetical protein